MASKKKQQNLFSSTTNKLAEYEAKQQAQVKLSARRKNDNRLALIASGAALIVALGSQFTYSAINAEPAPVASATPTTPTAQETNGPLVPNVAIAENRVWTGSMQVNGNELGISLFGDKAPQATANFIDLSNKDFYKDVTCHRLTTSIIYVLQCGDPTGTGAGGPGYSFGPIENAPAADATGVANYKKGVLAMANSGSPYSNGSQFFIVYADSPLKPDYTVFGEITSGLASLDPIVKAGVANGAEDGKPVVETKLGVIKLN